MSTFNEFPSTQDEVKCSYHPNVMTRLRCSRCGKPICPKCGVRTPVGLRCPECAGVRGLPTYRTDSRVLMKAFFCGLAVAVVVGVIWGYLPTWGFYLSLALGFGVAEAMAWASRAKRGRDLLVVGWIMIALGLFLSRAVLAQRLGIPWDVINQMTPAVQRVLNLGLIPHGIFAVLSFLIVWLRFR